MKRLVFVASCVLVCSSIIAAQSSSDYNKTEFYAGYSLAGVDSNVRTATLSLGAISNTYEPCTTIARDLFLGANFQRFHCERRGYNGFDASVTHNFTRYVGIKADVTGHFRNETFVDTFTGPPIRTDTEASRERIYNFLAGVQIKNNSRTARFKPFVHALVGIAHQRVEQKNTSTDNFNNFTTTDTLNNFAMKLGGGIDIRVGRKIDLRLFELDYNPVFAGDRSLSLTAVPPTPTFSFSYTGARADTFTFGFGIVIH
ncbi:MAG: hypothetical protein QOJ64_347 [Acidobacteriota bacterium]|jgi:opacity protein-like surface antigen|nr:hypothetical protein [Acidobacteriota bacterium]